MPHVDLTYYPRNLNAEEKKDLANAIVEVLKSHLGTTTDAVSIAMHEVMPDDWKAKVYDPIIKPQLDTLAKKPGYKL